MNETAHSKSTYHHMIRRHLVHNLSAAALDKVAVRHVSACSYLGHLVPTQGSLVPNAKDVDV